MANEAQISLWNGCAGEGWVKAQELLDSMFTPFERMLMDSLSPAELNILDIGCGTGATTLAAARRSGASNHCVGADISEPMIALARSRATQERSAAQFIVADAQTHDFGNGTFDAVISRFGVMFFEDPVRAFANLRRATRKGGRLHCLTFRDPAENPFMTAAERAAAPFLPAMPPRRADVPGQFAFANADRVRRILELGGWSSIQHLAVDMECVMPASALDGYATRLGPVGVMLQQVDAGTRRKVTEVVRAAFEPYRQGNEVRFTAACWRVSASA